jgi:sugar O-acyltransferase (sialic acid O-acetyltransferase NeuD family)
MPQPVTVIGAGGHAKVVISTLQAAGFRIQAVFDDDRGKWGQSLLDHPIRGPLVQLVDTDQERAIAAIGDNATREVVVQSFRRIVWSRAVHPAAYVHPSAELGPGTVVCAGAVIQPDTRIGAHAIINTGATVDHDCLVEDYAHLAPGVHLAGGVRVGRGAFLGIGSVVLPYCSIGDWTVVGAGGVVARDLPSRVTAVGVPARITRESHR